MEWEEESLELDEDSLFMGRLEGREGGDSNNRTVMLCVMYYVYSHP